jgi:hypothetical protein
MAKYNEILVGRYNRFMQKLMGMKGGAVVPQLAGDVQCTFSFFNGAENRYLEGWDRYAFAANILAVALNNSVARIRNPVGSNLIAIIEKILFFNADVAAQNPVLRKGNPTVGLAAVLGATNAGLDTRGRSAPTLEVSQQNTAVGAPLMGADQSVCQAGVLAGLNFEFILFENQELPLLPGQGLQLNGGVNQPFVYAFWWRERFLEESERT